MLTKDRRNECIEQLKELKKRTENIRDLEDARDINRKLDVLLREYKFDRIPEDSDIHPLFDEVSLTLMDYPGIVS